MGKITCNVVKDLLPSYVDEICSDDSRRVIEEHLSDCERCREYYELLTDTEFVDTGLGRKQIHYLKKIQRSYLVMALVVLFFFAAIFKRNQDQMNVMVLYMFTFGMAAAGVIIRLKSGQPERQKLLLWIGIILPVVYMSIWHIALAYAMKNEIYVWGVIDDSQIGPVLDAQSILMVVIEICLFCYQWRNGITKQESSTAGMLMSLVMTDALLQWDYTLYNMSAPDGYVTLLVRDFIFNVVMGIVGISAFYVIRGWRRHKSNLV